MELHLTGAFGIDEIIEFNRSGVATEWNFPTWFPLRQLADDVILSRASNVIPNRNAVLYVVNLSDEIWQSIKDRLPEYHATVLVQTEAYQGWEVAYEKCGEFDMFLNYDRGYAWHPGFIQIRLPYDSATASSHLDRRGLRSLAKHLMRSPHDVLDAATEFLLPRRNKAALIATLHLAARYQNRLDAARMHANWVDVYGGGWPAELPNYRGRCLSKLSTLRRYMFALVFENQKQHGYITEKLLDCFAAGTVPIYWGAPDIAEYVPEGTFLLAEDFLTGNDVPVSAVYKECAARIRKVRDDVLKLFSVNQFVESQRRALSLATAKKCPTEDFPHL